MNHSDIYSDWELLRVFQAEPARQLLKTLVAIKTLGAAETMMAKGAIKIANDVLKN